jgi:hypothetical protein
MNTYGGVGVQIKVLLTLTFIRGEWSASCPSHFIPGERAPRTHWIGGWVGPRAGLDNMEKKKCLTPLGLELRPLSHPACSQLLYQLRYPNSVFVTVFLEISCAPA